MRLTTQVDRALKGSTARHPHYKISISGLGTISRGANTSSAPASNEKIFTASALLAAVGGSYRYVTQVSGTSAPVAGVLGGDLVLIGSGDPTLTRGNLNGLARSLYASGLRRVTGRLVVDDSRYAHGTRAPGWKHSFLPGESGAVDAFSVNNDNWKSSSTFLRDPTGANAKLWRAALKNAGIHIAGATAVTVAPKTLVPLASHSSRPLSTIVKMTLRESINYYAEMMLRELGWQASGHGSRASGVAAIRRFARGSGLPIGRVEDGSGLSYRNRETPGNYIAWLTKIGTLPSYPDFFKGLAVSCRPGGTLRYRLCGGHVKGEVHAKTGTLDNITSLSGYTRTEGGRDVSFSFLFSGVRSTAAANRHIDDAIVAVVRSTA
ncbi:MAG TPA: D-alanyl-D-alanine carboxypeptidase [Mycobacteriales bacterium]|jgi:D-alanyl-D-alanine carboxypeptidase/D-alanyl-D-alanine-endopeptidase (penicillin-binding protein 4)|nr:D-alanyl-D-alanine carboxypeptidase [Mycobacteriales bacterium]